MLIFASDKYINQIKLLWKQAFGDSDASTDYYFSNIHENGNMLLDVDGGEVASMLTMLPIHLKCGTKSVRARYIYAVATHEKYRNQGRSTRLMGCAHDYMKKNGISVSVLVPATESLFGFYERCGYTRAFRLGCRSFCSCEIQDGTSDYSIELCSESEYFKMRADAFGDGIFAEWDAVILKKIMNYARFCGGEFYKIQTQSGSAALYVVRNGTTVTVKEFAACNMSAQTAAEILHKRLGADKYVIRTRADGGVGADFAMARIIGTECAVFENAYFNLAMD